MGGELVDKFVFQDENDKAVFQQGQSPLESLTFGAGLLLPAFAAVFLGSTQSISCVWYQIVARSSKTRLNRSPTATRARRSLGR